MGTDLAVVWDMGGVFNRYFTQVMVDVGRSDGWPLHRIPLGPSGQVEDTDYEDMNEGRIEEARYLEILLGRLRAEGIPFDPRVDIDQDLILRPETWRFIDRLHREGRTQAILTNDASKWMGERWWETWERAWYFDPIVDVATLGVRKPAPEAFLAVCEAMGRSAETCIFVDDMAVNCRGAEAIGMTSLRFDILEPNKSLIELAERIRLP